MHNMTVSKKFALFAWWDSKKENQIPGNNQFMQDIFLVMFFLVTMYQQT